MIWWNLVLFVVSFVLTALLAPKPNIEDARPDSLDSLDFPRATEDAPVPLVLGDVWVEAPNTIWYGAFKNVPITEKIRVSLFKKKTIIKGYRYFLSMNLALCLGVAKLTGIRIDDKDVSDGGTFNYTYQTWSDVGVPFISSISLPSYTSAFVITLADYGISDLDINEGGYKIRNYLDVLLSNFANNPIFSWNLNIQYLDEFNTPISISGEVTQYSIPDVDVNGRYQFYYERTIPANRGIRKIALSSNYSLFLTSATVYENSWTLTGNKVTLVTGDIYAPELFGGKENGGGWIGDYTFYPGDLDQEVDNYLISKLGSGNVPAYNGVCHIVMPRQYIGESVNLRKIAFRLQVYSNNLGLPNAGKIGTDINPSEAIVEIIVNKWKGLGKNSLKIDKDSFYDAGVVLYNEGMGISIQVTSTQNGKELVREILRHVDGIIFEHPRTGLITLKLIRQDYDEEDLPLYDENDIISIDNFTRTTWEDVYSQVKLSYTSRDKQSNITAVAQDMAIANMNGSLKTSQISFPFFYEGATATKVAARELSQLSVPIFKLNLNMNRNGFSLLPGDVFKVSWPEYGIAETIIRVGMFNAGELLNNRVVIDCAQDVFAVNTTVFAPPSESLWIDETGVRPPPVVAYYVTDIPQAIVDYLDLEFVDGMGFALTMPIRPSLTTPTYSTILGVTSNVFDYPQDFATFPLYFTLTTAIDTYDGFDNGVITTVTAGYDPTLGDLAYTGSTLYYEQGLIFANEEWMGFDSISNDGVSVVTVMNLYRGLLGTVPVDHPIGTKFVIFDYESIGDLDITTELDDTEPVYFKFITQNASTTRDVDNDAENTYTLRGVTSAPVRPRDLQLDGLRVSIFVPAADYIQNLTWVASDRQEFAKENDATQTPDFAEEYDLEIVDADDVSVFTDTNITSPYSIDFTYLPSLGTIRLWARRTSDSVLSPKYAFLPFEVERFDLLLSGDMQSGIDKLKLTGDEQDTGTDVLNLSGV